MSKTPKPRNRFKYPRVGVCRVCGCTDSHACAGGCFWEDAAHTLCTACAGTVEDMAYVIDWCLHLVARYGKTKSVAGTMAGMQRAVLARVRQRDKNGLPMSLRESAEIF